MQFTPLTASVSMPVHTGEQEQSQQTEDLAYQAMTVVAILLVLASIWIF
jgi:hypothetical protein